MKMKTEYEEINKSKAEKPEVYRCIACGVTMQHNGTPKVCPKCDNNKFYRVK